MDVTGALGFWTVMPGPPGPIAPLLPVWRMPDRELPGAVTPLPGIGGGVDSLPAVPIPLPTPTVDWPAGPVCAPQAATTKLTTSIGAYVAKNFDVFIAALRAERLGLHHGLPNQSGSIEFRPGTAPTAALSASMLAGGGLQRRKADPPTISGRGLSHMVPGSRLRAVRSFARRLCHAFRWTRRCIVIMRLRCRVCHNPAVTVRSTMHRTGISGGVEV